MRVHTNGFKNQIKELGREIDSRIIYGNETIDSEQLFSVNPIVNGNILKSAMKILEFESSVQVPITTIVKYEFGLKVNDVYEYLDFGNYIVYSSELNEDTKTYKHICYDSMLFSMKEYTTLQNGTFPMTIREYLTNLCLDCNLIFKNSNSKFANYDKILSSDLYANLGYTYRDIFDELSAVTASTICINSSNMVEVRYINETNDTIDEESLKDINVKFGEKYGPINSIVLSRSGQSDNVYLQDQISVGTNGLCEIKIIDNQIMNFNDRSDYLPDILKKLNGLEYYINDYSSTGILYYELCDKYNVQIGENTYSCILFNDEPEIKQGLVENIYTDMPDESVTDYTKSDKTDRKINQTYLIVDKQNQKIESVVSQTNEQNQKIAQVTQTVEELNSKIGDIADITTSGEDTDAQVELNNINQSEPIRLVVRPIGENISYLYPSDNLYPSDDLYMSIRTIRFHNNTTNENFDYELPDDLLYYDSENYDEFILDYDGQSCVINKRVGYNADGTTYVLDTPTTIEYEFPRIILTEGDYTVSILSYENGYIFARLMAKNIYTTQFYTKAEVDSEISQTAQSIDLSVNNKLSNYSTTTEMNSAISLKANEVTSSVSSTYATKNELTKAQSTIKQTTDSISSEVSKKVGDNEIISAINQTSESIKILANKLGLTANDVLNIIAGNEINLTSKNISLKSNNCSIDKNGNAKFKNGEFEGKLTSTEGNIGGWNINGDGLTNGAVFLNSDGSSTIYTVADLIIIRGYIMGTPGFGLSSAMIKHYDLNGDGVVNAQDFVLLQNLIGISMN